MLGTYFTLCQLAPQFILLLLAGEISVDSLNLVAKLVDERLEFVLLFGRLSNELILDVHRILLLEPGILSSLVQRRSAR